MPDYPAIDFKTRSGALLRLQRVHRSVFDQYGVSLPPPEPPTDTVTILGGATEEVPNYNDQAYQRELLAYNINIGQLEFNSVVRGVTMVTPASWQADEAFQEWLLVTSYQSRITSVNDYLKYWALADDHDLVYVSQAVRYLSTVTERGIDEAMQAFNITWLGVPLQDHPDRKGHVEASMYYASRVAARAMGYHWENFCELSGIDQSAVVAQFYAENKLELLQRRRNDARHRAGRR